MPISREESKASRDRREKTAGIVDLDLDPSEIDNVIASVRALSTVTTHVMVLVTPVQVALLGESTKALTNRTKAIERIRRETGACVIDLYRSSRFETKDFGDFDHMSIPGATKLTGIVADQASMWMKTGTCPPAPS